LLRRLGWDGAAPDLAGLRALSLRATGSGCSVGHIPKILFHRRAMPGQRLSRVKPAMPTDRPMVSVIIPTRDRADLLRAVTQGVLARTDYPSLELLIVDNDSREADTHDLLTRLSADARVKVLPAPGAFNWSVMNNQAARSARGDVLVLLNNDIDIVAPEWLSELVAEAMRPEIGIAGAKLIYPDGTLQHGGMTIGADGFFAHAMRHAPGGDSGCVGEMAVTRSVASVTGACLAIRRDLFLAVGGLDEDQLGFTHNDIDLCLRLRHAGYRVVYTPAAILVHHETATRGLDMSEAQLIRVRTEWLCLRARWGALATTDPYLNRNLTLLRDRFALQSPALLIETHENA